MTNSIENQILSEDGASTGYILNWLCFADFPVILSLQISKMLEF